MVQAAADGTQSAVDAATARATLGAGTSNLALGETSSTAYRGDLGATAYTHSQATGNPHGTTAAQVGAVNKSGDTMAGDLGFLWASSSNAVLLFQPRTISFRDQFGTGTFLQIISSYDTPGTTEPVLKITTSSPDSYFASLDVQKNVTAGASFLVGADKVIGARQAGMGATLSAATIGATYNSTVQGQIQALYDKVILLETKLKAHGLIAD